MKNIKIQYYNHFTDDFFKTKGKDYQIPVDYKWVHSGALYRLGENILLLIAKAYAKIYLSICLGIQVRDRTSQETYEIKGCFLYGNHTLPQGDAFIPLKCKPCHRIYTVVNASNLGIPILGKLLPMLGAIPIPGSLHQMLQFRDTIYRRIKEGGCVVIYPEAHVWPYYTGIRSFEQGAFSYPANIGVPCFCSTVTYQKRRWRKKPVITIWLDGPFYPDMSLKKKQRQKKLEREIWERMYTRSRKSTYEYIHYEEIKR